MLTQQDRIGKHLGHPVDTAVLTFREYRYTGPNRSHQKQAFSAFGAPLSMPLLQPSFPTLGDTIQALLQGDWTNEKQPGPLGLGSKGHAAMSPLILDALKLVDNKAVVWRAASDLAKVTSASSRPSSRHDTAAQLQ